MSLRSGPSVEAMMIADGSTQVLEYPCCAAARLEQLEEWARLSQRCPVAHARLPSGGKAVLLTRSKVQVRR